MTRQSGLNQRPHPSSKIYFPVEGTVVAVHFPNDSTNVTKNQMEYDVEPTIAGMGRIKNVPLAVAFHGIEDDDEIILTPAKNLIPQGAFTATTGVGDNTDGDKVIVTFLYGSWTSPRITSILSHPSRGRQDSSLIPRYNGKLEMLTPGPARSVDPKDGTITGGEGYAFGDGSDGSTAVDLAPVVGDRQRHVSINGTHMAVDRNGDVFVNFKANPDPSKNINAGAVTKKFVIQNEGKDLLRIDKDGSGNVNVTIAESFASNILFKIAGGSQSATIAEKLQSLYTTLKGKLDAFDAHIHVTGTGNSGPPTPTVSAPAWDSDINSNKVKIPGN